MRLLVLKKRHSSSLDFIKLSFIRVVDSSLYYSTSRLRSLYSAYKSSTIVSSF